MVEKTPFEKREVIHNRYIFNLFLSYSVEETVN